MFLNQTNKKKTENALAIFFFLKGTNRTGGHLGINLWKLKRSRQDKTACGPLIMGVIIAVLYLIKSASFLNILYFPIHCITHTAGE